MNIINKQKETKKIIDEFIVFYLGNDNKYRGYLNETTLRAFFVTKNPNVFFLEPTLRDMAKKVVPYINFVPDIAIASSAIPFEYFRRYIDLYKMEKEDFNYANKTKNNS